MEFKKGDRVTQIQPAPIVGEIVGFSLDQENGEVMLSLEYEDEDGNTHYRDFKQSEFQLSVALRK